MDNRRKSDIKSTPNILIVDNDEKNLFALHEILDEMDCKIIEARSGEDALYKTLKSPFALILLDVQMPDMDGFEVATLLKKRNQTKDIPIIFLTAYSKDTKHIQHGLLIGGADYILKPFDPVILTSKVSVYLEYYIQKESLSNQLQNLSMIQENLSERNAELQLLAKHDSLTGLYNRHSFEELLANSIQAAKEKNSAFSLMYMDLDNFKQINDKYGHDVGDELLKYASFRIREVLRSTDYFNYHNNEFSVSRLGGDEFSVILTDLSQPEVAGNVADRILLAFKEPFVINNFKLFIGMSIGIAVYPNAGSTIEMLCKHADQAMYTAKNSGKHAFHFYSNEMQQSHELSVELEASMRQSIQEQEFYLLYQPIYQLTSRQIVGAEVLCRLNHQALGEVMPDKFIPVAERSKLIIDLGKWILSQAITDFSSFAPNISSSFFLAINISMHQLCTDDLLDIINKLLSPHSIEHCQLELELTESAIDPELVDSSEIIHKLTDQGISISIDDFGTGYSSLKRLKELPIKTLKIDRSFMHEIDSVSKDENMIITIMELANNLNKRVIAEGIETEKQLQFLINQGCEFGQGFLLSKPIPLERLLKLINNS